MILPHATAGCRAKPGLQAPIRDPARLPWHEVVLVAHYWLEVKAMGGVAEVRENESQAYGNRKALAAR